jgi:hypothetical protein
LIARQVILIVSSGLSAVGIVITLNGSSITSGVNFTGTVRLMLMIQPGRCSM